MTDSEFLFWISERIEHVYGESHYVDFLHRLRSIAEKLQPSPALPHLGTETDAS